MQTKYILAAGVALAIGVPSVAVATGEGQPIDGGARNPTNNASQSYTRETEIIASNGTYGTRQSNKRDGDGGGAIYGCRSNAGNEPCVRANNLKGGRAFEFDTVGKEAGRIEVGDASGAPFTTNATGVATGLNADKVDGKEASELAAAGDFLWAAVSDGGALIAGRGATAASRTDAGNNTYRVTFSRDVSKCSFTANAVGGSSGEALGVSPASGQPNQVEVDEENDATGGTAEENERNRAFHLQVIC